MSTIIEEDTIAHLDFEVDEHVDERPRCMDLSHTDPPLASHRAIATCGHWRYMCADHVDFVRHLYAAGGWATCSEPGHVAGLPIFISFVPV